MSAINTELLILEVKKYELLYNQEHPQYKDYRQKDRIFDNEISKAMGGENGK